jgi:hypothetical protein
MMFDKLVLWALLIVPWLSLFFLKKESVNRYMPVAIFTALLMTIYNELAYTYKFWELKVEIFPQVTAAVPFVYGAFLVIVIWIFHYTYGRFWVYLVTNVVLDFLFAFPLNYFFEKILRLYELIHHNSWIVWGVFIVLSILIYGYQVWQEGVLKQKIYK